MDAINLYILCKGAEVNTLCEYQNALSNSYNKKQIKKEEIQTLKSFVNELLVNGAELIDLDGFFFGFTIPQISKEFDLLKIYEDDFIINVELKSQLIDLAKLEYQLKKNRYYLSHLNKRIYSITYVQTENNGKIYLYDGNELKECEIRETLNIIKRKSTYVKNDIEKLFKCKNYLISPINTPDSFIKGNYYLTVQQETIKNKIVDEIKNNNRSIWGIQGSAGTGKTLLLYDIAKELSQIGRVCIIHSGILSDGHIELNSKMNEFDIISVKACVASLIMQYDYILVDEAQRLYQGDFDCILSEFKKGSVHCIFAYDYFQVLSFAETNRNIPEQLKKLDEFKENKLSEKIRTNKEISSFIKNVRDLTNKPKSYMNYRNIEVLYAENYSVARTIIDFYESHKEYKFISYTPSRVRGNEIDEFVDYVNTHHIIGQEFDNVIFSMDNNFRYGKDGRLQGREHPNPDYIFYKLWYQGVSRAREKLCILVIGNKPLFENILKVKTQFEK